MRRKSPKTHQEPPGSWTSGTRGRTPLDSPAFCPSGIGRGNLNPQASSGASHPPSHGLKAESVPSMKPEEKTRPICPLSSKWQIGLGLWQKVARRETERSAASAKRATATHRGIPKGGSPWRAFGDFPRDGKVTRGRRGGAPSTLRVEAKSGDLLRELCSHKGSAEGATPPRKEAGAAGPTGQYQLALRRRRTASSSASVSKRSVLMRA